MALICGSPTVTRIRVQGPCPADVPDRLLKNRFVSIDHTADESSFGWTSIDDMLDCDWKEAPPEKGEFFCFGLRMDKRRIPPAVLKKEIKIEIDKELAKNKEEGKNFISRDRKREIKEQVTLKLRAQTRPIPSTTEIVWDRMDGILYVGTSNQKAIELLMDFFTLTFEVELVPMNPGYLSMAAVPDLSALDGISPTLFTHGG